MIKQTQINEIIKMWGGVMKYERLTEKDRYWNDEELWTQSQEPTVEEIDKIYNRLAELEDNIENGTLVELPFMRQRNNGQWEIIYIDENGYTSVRAFTNKDEAEKRLEMFLEERK